MAPKDDDDWYGDALDAVDDALDGDDTVSKRNWRRAALGNQTPPAPQRRIVTIDLSIRGANIANDAAYAAHMSRRHWLSRVIAERLAEISGEPLVELLEGVRLGSPHAFRDGDWREQP